MHQKHKNTIT